jgi:hypothetical protein
MTIRIVRESLDRWQAELKGKATQIQTSLKRARTAVGAIEEFLSEEEDGKYALKRNVTAWVEGPVDDSCFIYDDDFKEYRFDFDKLDKRDLGEYLALRTKFGPIENDYSGEGIVDALKIGDEDKEDSEAG